jgi:hypothetical protein
VTAVCLRSWNGNLGNPAFFSRRGHQDRLVRLWQFTGVPLREEKIHSDPPVPTSCLLRVSMAMAVSRMLRLDLAVFGPVAPLPDRPPDP